jgi:hypothetical protein
MSLINCPECGKEISEKVKACPYCGFPFINEVENLQEQSPQQVELTGVNLKQQLNLKWIIIGLAIIIVGVIIIFSSQYLKQQKAQRDYELAFNTYIDNLFLLRLTTIGGGVKAEELANLTAKVWANSIYEKADPETDMYTRVSITGRFNDDFNTSLKKLFTDTSIISKINDIKEYQIKAKDAIEKLQNPPTGLETCYETATDMYAAFLSFTNSAISPTGSLLSYNQDRGSKTDSFLDLYNKLEAQIPEKFVIDE